MEGKIVKKNKKKKERKRKNTRIPLANRITVNTRAKAASSLEPIRPTNA